MDEVTIELSSRALTKLDRAGRLFSNLDQAIDAWNNQHQVSAPIRVPIDGPNAVEFYRPASLADEIPWDDWESTFHDGVHNLRVALDSLCFEMCHFEGKSPAKPGSVHFPITMHPNEWPAWKKILSSAPEALLERVRQCQPWCQSEHAVDQAQEPDPLVLISRIDNLDKHRATGVTLEILPWPQWDEGSLPLPAALAQSVDWPLDLWVRMEVAEEMPRGAASLQRVFVLPMLMFEGQQAVVPDAQRWLYSRTERIINFIATGKWVSPHYRQVFPGTTWSALDIRLES